MKQAALVVLTLVAILGVNHRRMTMAQDRPRVPVLPQGLSNWDLIRDFKIDGKVEEGEHTTLQLLGKDKQLSGHYTDKKALGNDNASTFTGEVVTREMSLLILRQELSRNGGYVLIHTGHLVGENHFRGTWYDNGGKSGDFELKLRK